MDLTLFIFNFLVGLNDPRSIFPRHTSQDGRRTFLTNKQFASTSDESHPQEESEGGAAIGTSNGEFCVDMLFRYKYRRVSIRAVNDILYAG